MRLTLDPSLTFIGADPPSDSLSAGGVYWHFDELPLFDEVVFALQVLCRSSLWGPCFHPCWSAPLSSFRHPLCSEWQEVLACAYDPNDKQVAPAGQGELGVVPISTSELTWTIRFRPEPRCGLDRPPASSSPRLPCATSHVPSPLDGGTLFCAFWASTAGSSLTPWAVAALLGSGGPLPGLPLGPVSVHFVFVRRPTLVVGVWSPVPRRTGLKVLRLVLMGPSGCGLFDPEKARGPPRQVWFADPRGKRV